MKRVMWVEYKGEGLRGPARIGWVRVRDRGRRIDYQGKVFRSLGGTGFKANFCDLKTGEQYWISGCHRDGRDALYSTKVEVDDDALEEYWVNIRRKPENVSVRKFHVVGKYTK